MAFADYKPDYVEVKDASGKLVGSVRPLNDVDFILLWRKHPSAMDAVLAGLLAAVHRGKQTDLAAAMSESCSMCLTWSRTRSVLLRMKQTTGLGTTSSRPCR